MKALHVMRLHHYSLVELILEGFEGFFFLWFEHGVAFDHV